MRKWFPRVLSLSITLMMLLSLALITPTLAAVSAPKAATGLKAVSASATSIKLTWTAVTGAKGYGIYRSVSQTGTYTGVGVATTNTFTNTGLKTGTNYYYKVRTFVMSGTTRVYGAYSTVAVAKPVAPPVPINYKGVVFIPSFASFQLGTECYSNNLGTRELANKKNGPASMHYPYIWQENYPINPDRALTAMEKKDFDADMKLAPRYFRVNLTKAQKVGTTAAANWKAAIARGDAPGFIWAQYPIPTDSTAIPTTTTKIYIRSFIDDYAYSKRYKTTDFANQAALYVSKVVKDFDRIAAARPNAKLYVGSMELTAFSFPRIDNPKLLTDSLLAKWGGMIGTLSGAKAWTLDYKTRGEINRLIEAYCKTKGYTFVDLTKSGLTDSNGYLLEKYAHVNGVGYQMNQAGLTLEGDYICKAMGLPTAKQAYNLK